MVFDAAWFARHQRSLVAALNMPGLGRELRAAFDVSLSGRVVMMRPHCYVVQRPDDWYTAEFRTADGFARRLCHELMPVWRLAHWFDQRIANPFIPALNLGFDTLTRYPDEDPETTTFDGWVSRHAVDETFAVIIAGAGTFTSDTDTSGFAYLESSAITDQFVAVRRAPVLFDTSALSSSIVTAGTLSVWGNSKNNGLGSPDLHVVSSAPASNTGAAAADYGTFGSTSFGSVAYASFVATDSAYTDIALNASGLAVITKSGITKLGLVTSWDQAASFTGAWGSNSNSYLQWASAENASGTAKAPKLVVTYTPFISNTRAFSRKRHAGHSVSSPGGYF